MPSHPRRFIVAVSLIALLLVTVGAVVEAPTVSADRPKWEYRVAYYDLTQDTRMIAELNALGKEGWELVAVTMPKVQPGPLEVKPYYSVFLKRRR